MKRYLYLILTLVLCSCEVINEADRLIPMPLPANSEHRHVLIEFTGFRCVNCPEAAQTAQALKEAYPNQLYVVAMHPASNPFTQGKYDYTCPAADSIYQLLGGTSTTPFPAGNIDLDLYEESYLAGPEQWTTMVYEAMTDTVAPYLYASAKADSIQREIQVTPQYTANDDLQIAYWLIEDSVLGVQAMPDGSVNMNYYHRHLLRAVSEQASFPIPDECRPAYCSVVAVLYDKNNHYILNSYETFLDFSANH